MSIPVSQLRAVPAPDAAPQAAPAPLAADPRFPLLTEIERLAAKARELNLDRVALVLDLAHLELKTNIHNVTDDELRMLSRAAHSELRIEDLSP
jgi:hypothetical protein